MALHDSTTSFDWSGAVVSSVDIPADESFPQGDWTGRRRTASVGLAHGEYRLSGSFPWTDAIRSTYTLDQYTVSRSSGREWWNASENSSSDKGSGFASMLHGYNRAQINRVSSNLFVGYVGPPSLRDLPGSSGYPFKSPLPGSNPSHGVARQTPSGLLGFGTHAIAVTNPGSPLVDLPSIIGEIALGGGLPRMIGHNLRERVGSLRGRSADEYLNVQFGWFPLIADIKELVRTVLHAQEALDQYLRDAGRSVRRRYVETPTTQTWSFNRIGATAFPTTSGLSSNSTVVEQYYKARWFSGRFRYFVPLGDDAASRIERYRKMAGYLLGLKSSGMTPDQVWQIAPWSWLVDWFSDIGDIISNVTNLGIDSTVLEYGYAMQLEQTVRTESGVIRKTGAQPVGPYPFSSEFISSRKVRAQANPYGFEVDWSGLSLKQISILAALGITRTG